MTGLSQVFRPRFSASSAGSGRFGVEAVFAFAGIVTVSFLVRAYTFLSASFDWDEGIYVLMGASLLEGHLPYTEFWDVKPPLIYFTYALGLLPFDQSLAGVRILAVSAVAASGFVIYLFLRRICDCGFLAALGSGVLYAVFTSADAGAAANTELFIAPLTLGALFLLLSEIVRSAEPTHFGVFPWRIVLAGFLVALAIQFKYTALFDFLFFLVILGIGISCEYRDSSSVDEMARDRLPMNPPLHPSQEGNAPHRHFNGAPLLGGVGLPAEASAQAGAGFMGAMRAKVLRRSLITIAGPLFAIITPMALLFALDAGILTVLAAGLLTTLAFAVALIWLTREDARYEALLRYLRFCCLFGLPSACGFLGILWLYQFAGLGELWFDANVFANMANTQWELEPHVMRFRLSSFFERTFPLLLVFAAVPWLFRLERYETAIPNLRNGRARQSSARHDQQVRDADPAERRSLPFRNSRIARNENGHVAIRCVWTYFGFICLSVYATKRFYDHYFLLLLPVLCLCAGYFVDRLAGMLREITSTLALPSSAAGTLVQRSEAGGRKPVFGKVVAQHGEFFPQVFRLLAISVLFWGAVIADPALPGRLLDARELARGDALRDDVSAVSRWLRDHGASGKSIYVLNANPVIYYLADAEPPTRYAFPPFLIERFFVGVAGVDREAEVRRIFRGQPEFIVKLKRPLQWLSHEDHLFLERVGKLIANAYVVVHTEGELEILGKKSRWADTAASRIL